MRFVLRACAVFVVSAATACAGAGYVDENSSPTTEVDVSAAQVAQGDAGARACVKGAVKASEVAIIGESFIAATNAIPRNLTQHAREAGAIGSSESYRSFAVSGTLLTNGQIPGQYARAKAQGPVKVVLMDGGGNDLLMGGQCGSGAQSCAKILTTLQGLFKQMGADGVTDVLYFFYPDPMGIGASIKAPMDVLRPLVQKLCAETTDVRCTWVDQRESWNGNYDRFTADGIHPTAAGSAASAKQIWDAMVKNCIAQ